jgi:hypothetical protein
MAGFLKCVREMTSWAVFAGIFNLLSHIVYKS